MSLETPIEPDDPADSFQLKGIGKRYWKFDRASDRVKQMLLSPLLGRDYGREFWALRDVSFSVRKGECFGVVGRNGGGKSTLLQIAYGTLLPTLGAVGRRGRISALLELGSGFSPIFTGRENVMLQGAILGIPRAEMERRLPEIAAFADIGDFLDQPVKTYSSGMFVRLAFSVAVNVDPEVLIVDEALAVGDIAFQAKCFRKMEEFRAKGVTILFVSHDLGTVVQLCDRAVLLERGQVRALGPAKEVVDEFRRVSAEAVSEQAATGTVALTPAPTGSLRSRFRLNPGMHEYGDRHATIEDFGLLDAAGNAVESLTGGEELKLVIEVLVHRDLACPILAFNLRDLRGVEIFTTNTWYLGQDPGFCAAGTRLRAEFRTRFPLGGGTYALSFACTEVAGGGLAVHHRLFDALLIESRPARRFGGIADFGAEVAVERQAPGGARC